MLIKQLCPYMVLLRMGFTLPFLSPEMRCALTAPFHPYLASPGGLFSVALSLRSPSLEVIQHPDPVKPGLSSVIVKMITAAIQLSAHPLLDTAIRLVLSIQPCSSCSRRISSSSHISSFSDRLALYSSVLAAMFLYPSG